VFFSLPLFGQSKASSLITNPGFDTYGKCSSESSFACPLGYVVYRSNRTTASVGTTTNPYGNRKLTIRVGLEQGQDKPTIVDVVQTVHQFEPGHLYRFSAWVKAEDLRGESYLFVTAAEDNKAFRTQSNSLGKVHGTSSYSAWTKLNLFFEAPFTQTSIEIGMGVTTSSSDCDAKRCGAVHFDNLSLSRVTNITDMVARESHSNVCSDGEFLNNLSDKCQLLDKQFGHTHEARFNSTVYLKCEEMDSLKINKAIEAFGNAGGVVHLAPCVASLNDDIELASNVILQGSGVGRTVLYRHPDWDNESSTLIRVRGEKEQQLENVVLRDFTVIGSGPIESDMNNIQIRYSHNVLAERIETRNAGKSGISARSSQNVTIRYVIGHGSVR